MDSYMSVAGDCLLFAETIIRSLPDYSSASGNAKLSTNTSSSARPKPPVFTNTRDVIKFINSLGKGDLEAMAAQQKIDLSKLDHLKNVEIHQGFMKEAIAMANAALRSDETPVGCVFVHKGKIIGRGMNHTNKTLNGTRHAEFVALAEILQAHSPDVLHQTDLYVTVEPCIMCASALRQFGIRAVYFGCFNDRFGGTGGVLRIHDDDMSDPKYIAVPGIFREDAIMLLRKFYIQENEKAPEPKQKKTRELKTEIVPLDLTRHRDAVSPLSIASSMASSFASLITPAVSTAPATKPIIEPTITPIATALAEEAVENQDKILDTPVIRVRLPPAAPPPTQRRPPLARAVMVSQAMTRV